jgi:hypothetical protein
MAPESVWCRWRHVPPVQSKCGDCQAIVNLKILVHIVQSLARRGEDSETIYVQQYEVCRLVTYVCPSATSQDGFVSHLKLS